MIWRSLSEYVRTYRRTLPPHLRAAAHEIAEGESMPVALGLSDLVHWSGFALECPPAINLAMLAVRNALRPRVYTVRPSVSRLVGETDLYSIPSESPALLSVGGVVEARRPDRGETLWADVASIGWYHYAGQIWIVALSYPDGIMTTSWRPRWGGGEISDGAPAEIIGDREEHAAFLDSALRYLIRLGLLTEAEGSPLRVEIDAKDRSIADIYAGDHPRPPPVVVDSDRSSTDGTAPPGLVLEATRVRGHLKRQRHGAGGALRKWVYVSSYAARRWFDPRYVVERRNEWRPWVPRKSRGEHLASSVDLEKDQSR